MRIALVSPYALDVAGGVQAHVRSLAAALQRGGDEVLVVGPTAGAVGDGTGAEAGPVRVHTVGRTASVPANGSRAPVALGPTAALRLRGLLRRAAPDVVHVHEPLVPALGPAAVLATGAARVLTFHATAEGGALPRLYRAVRRPARRVVAGGDALTAVSPVAAAFHARMLGIDPEGIAIVPNGVDVARFAPEAPEEPREHPLLVFLGRLEHRKGADVAVDAFLRLAARRDGVRMRVLGGGPLGDALARRRAAAPPAIAQRLELVGPVAPEVLPELLRSADVAVLPARGGESFGIVLLEAMAADLAVVATDIPGYRAVARAGREALLVAPDDPDALAGAMERVLDDPALAGSLRDAGRLRAAEHDWAVVAERTRAVYAEAVAQARRRSA